MNSSDLRYRIGNYDFDFGDDLCKAREMRKVIERIPDIHTITSYADIGCGDGGVFVSLYQELLQKGFVFRRAIGYDIASAWHETAAKNPKVEFKTGDFLDDGIECGPGNAQRCLGAREFSSGASGGCSAAVPLRRTAHSPRRSPVRVAHGPMELSIRGAWPHQLLECGFGAEYDHGLRAASLVLSLHPRFSVAFREKAAFAEGRIADTSADVRHKPWANCGDGWGRKLGSVMPGRQTIGNRRQMF